MPFERSCLNVATTQITALSTGIEACSRGFLNSAGREFLRLWRRPADAGTGTARAAAIDRVIADLEKLNESTERDFLAVGEKLIRFRSTARQISSDMSALTELISGEQGRRAAEALGDVLVHSTAMETRLSNSSQALNGIGALSKRIRLGFSKLRETVSVFSVLCTVTRIETSRLGSAGAEFGDLADEVKPLAEKIQSGGERVLEASAQLDRNLQSAIESAAAVSAKQLRDLPVLIAAVMDELELFQERQQGAQDVSRQQSAEYAEVCRAIEELVESIQFHDITRQQVEHVAQALRQVRAGLKTREGCRRRPDPCWQCSPRSSPTPAMFSHRRSPVWRRHSKKSPRRRARWPRVARH